MKLITSIVILATGLLLLSGTVDFPEWGDVDSPANSYRISEHFIKETMTQTSVPNMVTAVLADYRGYDTLFETVVIFTAGIAVFAILWVRRPSEQSVPSELIESVEHRDLITNYTCRLVIPVIQLFALYVIAHGHYSPGGGFQGGVIFGASLILLAIANELSAALKRFTIQRAVVFASVGILIYAGTGVVCLIMGEQFLNYGILDDLLPGDVKAARSHSMLIVEVGVAFTVSAIMFTIYANLSSRGNMKGGL